MNPTVPKNLVQEIIRWQVKGKCGNILINFYKGEIKSITRTENLGVKFVGNVDDVKVEVSQSVDI